MPMAVWNILSCIWRQYGSIFFFMGRHCRRLTSGVLPRTPRQSPLTSYPELTLNGLAVAKGRKGQRSECDVHVSGWDIIRKTVYAISPFLRIYRSKVGWVQIAGHCGSFLPGDVNGTILKRETPRELKAFQQLQDDSLAKFVPTFYQSVAVEGSGTYLRMQDLLADMQAPIVMDVKMGTRTYLEDEIKPGEKPSYRSDLYKKMISVDASAPTEEEKERKGITKARYMQFREQMSSSATLGFRIDGIKLQTGLPMRDFKSVREECDVENRFLQYLHGNTKLWANCLHELTAFRLACSDSNFLKNHEVIGSSLLFVGEPETGNAGVWMIDFGKTCELHEEIGVDHFSQWEVGNHEDGYLHGLDNLIRIWIGLHDRVVETAFEEALSKGAQTTTTLTNGVAPEGECLKSERPQDQSPQGESPQGESPQLSTVQEAQETPPPAAAATEPNSPSPCTSSES
ncbi:inositol-trisphosphate 3-kinase A-like isoform X2 [Sycon ciliatum]|uniref:inositol-trisphosphate 3-kinase A-like isoform X2 n=1 Tax=Sycon ciliatum TaxID=27933 RepID=UPI0031F69E53